jgi:hypothetical protein
LKQTVYEKAWKFWRTQFAPIRFPGCDSDFANRNKKIMVLYFQFLEKAGSGVIIVMLRIL